MVDMGEPVVSYPLLGLVRHRHPGEHERAVRSSRPTRNEPKMTQWHVPLADVLRSATTTIRRVVGDLSLGLAEHGPPDGGRSKSSFAGTSAPACESR